MIRGQRSGHSIVARIFWSLIVAVNSFTVFLFLGLIGVVPSFDRIKPIIVERVPLWGELLRVDSELAILLAATLFCLVGAILVKVLGILERAKLNKSILLYQHYGFREWHAFVFLISSIVLCMCVAYFSV